MAKIPPMVRSPSSWLHSKAQFLHLDQASLIYPLGVGQCAWKVDCNDCCRDTGPTTGRLSTCSTVWTKRSSSRRSSKSSYSSLGASSATREEEKRVSKRLQTNPLGDLVEAPEIKTSPHNGAVSDHHAEKSCTTYRCTGCSRTFKSMQTWSRHEKEDHEDISFPCMPNGAIDVTARGRTCALCGQEPTEEHLRSHNIERCTQVRHVFKRSDQLKQHLETHGLKRRSRQSDLLVNKWQCVPDKRAWACGFCKSLFASLVDFHKHVAAQHYERGESRDWDHTKVILGLLSQPHIAGPWERLLAFRFRVQSLSCKWSKSKSGCLQTRLELGQEPGEVLAEAALECGIYDRDLLHEVFRIQEPFTPDLFGIAAPMVSGPPVPPKPLSSAPSSCSGGDFQSRAGHPMVDNKPFLELDLFPTTSPSFFDMSSYAWQVNMSNFEHPERRDPNHQYDINSDDNSGLIHPMDLNINQGLGFSSDAVVNDCH